MAKDNNQKASKQLNDYIGTMDQRMDELYRTTYSTSKKNRKDVKQITTDIEDTIKGIINRNSDADISNLTRLFSRLKLKQELGNKATVEEIVDFFGDQNLTNGLLQSYMANKWIKELDDEIDIICAYVPKLEEALDILKYATLSSDNYSKDFINVTTLNYNKDEQAVFVDRFDTLKKKYLLVEKISDYYDTTSKYGEQFVYCVPYGKEVERLLKRKSSTRKMMDFAQTSRIQPTHVNEMVIIENDVIKNNKIFDTISDSSLSEHANLSIIMDNRGVLESALEEYSCLSEKIHDLNGKSLHEQYLTEEKIDKTIADDLEIPSEFEDNVSHDGLINRKTSSIEKDINIKVPGCIIKKLKRENIIPLYIDDFCLGYYYFEFKSTTAGFNEFSTRLSSRTNMVGDNCAIHKKSQEDMDDYAAKLLNYISGYLSEKIDADFINKNQNLQKEIYSLLKHNDVFNDVSTAEIIKITFLPAEDVIHFAFEKDPDTHRGISDLAKGLIPAKLWACLYLSDSIGTMTRGQDKRVYYVKQNVETNISQTLLNVISQIKKSNFGLRQIETMNNVLNLVGRFNDYVIPVGQSGESPIQFEVMQGQQIETNTDLLDRLFDQAISGIVPRELLNTVEGIDFASQITATNIQFIRKIYNRQAIMEEQLSIFLTNAYNYEYGTNIKINCKLPAPLFLQMNNLTQILQNVSDMARLIGEMEYSHDQSEESQKEQALFVKNYTKHNLSTYIKIDEIEMIKERSRLEMQEMLKKTDNNM